MADRRYRALLVTNWEVPADPHGLPPLLGPRVDAEIVRADDHDGYVSVADLYQHVTTRMRDAGLSTPQRRFDDAVAAAAVAKTPHGGSGGLPTGFAVRPGEREGGSIAHPPGP